MNKTINIDVPEGFEIDTENSNLVEGKIVFKKKEEIAWRNLGKIMSGYWVGKFSDILEETGVLNSRINRNVFATEKQAKSALAMAQLSQIMQNDERFGAPITNADWSNRNITKYTIERESDGIKTDAWWSRYQFLAFRTKEQRDLFLKENEDLIKQYFMID